MRYCPHCGAALTAVPARFCGECGTAVSDAATSSHAVPPPAPPEEERARPTALLTTMRLLAAGCMASAILAALNLGSASTEGRRLIAASVLTALAGQLFVLQASKPRPPSWSDGVLVLFGIGIAATVFLWIGTSA